MKNEKFFEMDDDDDDEEEEQAEEAEEEEEAGSRQKKKPKVVVRNFTVLSDTLTFDVLPLQKKSPFASADDYADALSKLCCYLMSSVLSSPLPPSPSPSSSSSSPSSSSLSSSFSSFSSVPSLLTLNADASEEFHLPSRHVGLCAEPCHADDHAQEAKGPRKFGGDRLC